MYTCVLYIILTTVLYLFSLEWNPGYS